MPSLGHVGVDVGGQGQVDHAADRGAGQVVGGEGQGAGAGAADQHVGTWPGRCASSDSGTARPPTAAASSWARARVRLTQVTVGAGRSRGTDGQPGHGAGPDDQHPLAGQRAALVGEQPVRHADQGASRAADAGLGLHPLADPERLLEQGVERGADGALTLGQRERVLDLAEDLALPDHHRVQAGGDGEGVGHRTLVEVDRAAGLQLGHRQPAGLGERVGGVGQRAVEAGDRGVDLGAVAGGQDHRLVDVLAGQQLVAELGRRPPRPGPARPGGRPRSTCGRR